MSRAEDVARQLIAILVIDLEYDHQPHNGHAPIRHQLAWSYANDVLGEEVIKEHVDRCLRSVSDGHNGPVKTNSFKIRN